MMSGWWCSSGAADRLREAGGGAGGRNATFCARVCLCLLSLWDVAYGVKGSDWKIKAAFLELFLTFIYFIFYFSL